MSKPTPTTITCETCGNTQEFILWESVNVTIDSSLKDKLINGDLTCFICKKCGNSADVVYPLLYHDMQTQFMVWLWPDEQSPGVKPMALAKTMNRYRFRRVRNRNELVEKIFIFDRHFDDRLIELLKIGLKTNQELAIPFDSALLFSPNTQDVKLKQSVLFASLAEESQGEYSMGWSGYEAYDQKFSRFLKPEEFPDDWPIIDQQFAIMFLEQNAK